MTLSILHRDDLQLGGFAGLKEHRLIVDSRVGGQNDTWNGIGSHVYLADAKFEPYGETHMHSHHEIDVISVMVEGNINHEGSLEHGGSIKRNQAQVQRAGGEGFRHNEINPDGIKNRMIQLWVLPETSGEPAGYKLYDLKTNTLKRIYGGSKEQTETMDGSTFLDVGRFDQGHGFNTSAVTNNSVMIYITRGSGSLTETSGSVTEVNDGDLIQGNELEFIATTDDTQLIVISTGI